MNPSFTDALSKVLKYSTGRDRLPVNAVHPEVRMTKLGAFLREHATEPSEIGELAHQALLGDHAEPLELMPLHLLRDKLQENPDHPLAKQFNWLDLPEKVALDRQLRKATEWDAGALRGLIGKPVKDTDKEDAALLTTKLLTDHTWADHQDVLDSAKRVSRRFLRSLVKSPEARETVHKAIVAGDPENGYTEPEESF